MSVTLRDWLLFLAAGTVGAYGLYKLFAPGRAVDLVIRDAKLDTQSASLLRGVSARWNGRDVALAIASAAKPLPRRAMAQIAAIAPCRLRVRHISAEDIYMSGPPRIECRLARANMAVWADDEMLAQLVFSDPVAAERLAIAIVATGDAVEINLQSVRVEQSTERFESDYTALFAAWRAATQLVERLTLGVPPDGHLPFFEVLDTVIGDGE